MQNPKGLRWLWNQSHLPDKKRLNKKLSNIAKREMRMKQLLVNSFLITALVVYGSSTMAADKPLMVYILAGQSNMVGLGDVKTFDYIVDDPDQGYELAGFVWFQGWNEWCDSHTYPNRDKQGGYDLYSELMAHFICDVRKDLSAPKMPFVIDIMGVGGPMGPWTYEFHLGIGEKFKHFRAVMAAPAAMPQFKGNVVVVQTAPYWEKDLADIELKINQCKQMRRLLESKNKNGPNKEGKMTQEEQQALLKKYRANLITSEEEALWKRGVSNGGYRYLGCAKTYGQIGKAFAEALLAMKKK
jgi:alpha-galactosidase